MNNSDPGTILTVKDSKLNDLYLYQMLIHLPMLTQLQTRPHAQLGRKKTKLKSPGAMATIWNKEQGADNPVDRGPTKGLVCPF